MENKDLLVLIEGDDITGKMDLLNAYLDLMSLDNSDYCVYEIGLVDHFINYELDNKKCAMYVLLEITKFLRRNFDIVVIYVGTDAKDNVYEQFLLEQGANPEKINGLMQAFKSHQVAWLDAFNAVTVSDKKYETIFCSVDDCNNEEDFINKAKSLKEEIEKIINKK